MPGSVRVTVLEAVDLPALAENVLVKVQMGKRDGKTTIAAKSGSSTPAWDSDFAFPVLSLADQVIVTLMDDKGAVLGLTKISTPSIVEKGFRDELLELKSGEAVVAKLHLKMSFVLSEEERKKIELMRSKSLAKREAEAANAAKPLPSSEKASTAAASAGQSTPALARTDSEEALSFSLPKAIPLDTRGESQANSATNSSVPSANGKDVSVAEGFQEPVKEASTVAKAKDASNGEASMERSETAASKANGEGAIAQVEGGTSGEAQGSAGTDEDSAAPKKPVLTGTVSKRIQAYERSTSIGKESSALQDASALLEAERMEQEEREKDMEVQRNTAPQPQDEEDRRRAEQLKRDAERRWQQEEKKAEAERAAEARRVRAAEVAAEKARKEEAKRAAAAAAEEKRAQEQQRKAEEKRRREEEERERKETKRAEAIARKAAAAAEGQKGKAAEGDETKRGPGWGNLVKQLVGGAAVALAVFAFMPKDKANPNARYHVVRPGETLSQIVPEQCNNPNSRFFKLNPEVCDRNLIFPGQRLKL